MKNVTQWLQFTCVAYVLRPPQSWAIQTSTIFSFTAHAESRRSQGALFLSRSNFCPPLPRSVYWLKLTNSYWLTLTNLTAKANKMSVPPFLQKTYEIVSEPAFEDVCGWGENNDSIFIKDVSRIVWWVLSELTDCVVPCLWFQIDAFAKTVLPKYFKHSNYSSFTRQLHKVY